MTHSPELSIGALRDAFSGEIITPQDAGYDAARQVMMGGIDTGEEQLPCACGRDQPEDRDV